MRDAKINKLFTSAKRIEPPEASPGFPQNVLCALRRESQAVKASLLEQIGLLFPQLACAAMIIIAICIAADVYQSRDEATLSTEIQQLTDEWLFARQ